MPCLPSERSPKALNHLTVVLGVTVLHLNARFEYRDGSSASAADRVRQKSSNTMLRGWL
jgi:hypothetical protein